MEVSQLFTNANMTIYNIIPQKGTAKETYKRTVVKDVFWNESREITTSENGIKKEDIVRIMIPLESLNALKKEYKPPKAWLSTENKDNYYTFKHKDIIVKGIVKDEITTPKELEQKYDNVFAITSVSDNRYGSENMHHFFIIAK